MKPRLPKSLKLETKPSKFCPGCGQTLILTILGKVIDELKIARRVVYGCDIGCMLLSWDFFNVNTVQTHHGRTGPTLVGLKMADSHRLVIAYMGDGGAYAIGAQHLVATAMRNNPITVVVANNTNYAMTGGQAAPTTLCSQKTSSTPQGRDCDFLGQPFRGPELVRQINQKAYVARATTLDPLNLKEILKRALLTQIKEENFSFVEVLSACPTNWRTNAKETRQFLKEMEKVFPLGEIK